MEENLFVLLNLIILGIAGLVVLIYLIYLTRKRLRSGYTHPKDEKKSPQNSSSDT